MKRCTCILVLLSVGLIGCSSDKPSISGERQEQAGHTGDDALVAQGRKLYEATYCASCHSLDGTASDAQTFKGMYSKDQTVAVEGFPGGMHDPLSLEEATAVIAFIKSLR
jgi:mono/diheme cytochrome c family protein